MNELDRRIAVEIMGEPEPQAYVPYGPPVVARFVSVGGGWQWLWGVGWQPLPFSTSLEYAMKPVDKWLDAGQRYQGLWLILSYDRAPEARNEPWNAYLTDADDDVFYVEDDEYLVRYPGQIAPDAICNLLLALAKLPKEKP